MNHPTLAELLPHQRPMLLLDELVDSDDTSATTRVVLRPDSMFVRAGWIHSIVALEYMAQCAAAYAGLRRRIGGAPPQAGYLVGTPAMEVDVESFQVGDELTVLARYDSGTQELQSFACSVSLRGREVARARISVYGGDRAL